MTKMRICHSQQQGDNYGHNKRNMGIFRVSHAYPSPTNQIQVDRQITTSSHFTVKKTQAPKGYVICIFSSM